MTNGGYKILDLKGEEIVLESESPLLSIDVISVIKKAESSGKPILISNVKFMKVNPGSTPLLDTEITVPVFFNICKTSDGYAFILPNGITGIITEENEITANQVVTESDEI